MTESLFLVLELLSVSLLIWKLRKLTKVVEEDNLGIFSYKDISPQVDKTIKKKAKFNA